LIDNVPVLPKPAPITFTLLRPLRRAGKHEVDGIRRLLHGHYAHLFGRRSPWSR
jgi:hypothetical protein